MDGWHISKPGRCRLCSLARAVAQVNAVFPPDPGSDDQAGRSPWDAIAVAPLTLGPGVTASDL